MEEKTVIKLAVSGVVFIILLVLTLILNPFVIIHAGEKGVVLNWGAFNGEILEPGLHWRTPIVQSVVKMSVRTEAIEREKSEAYTHDIQPVDIHSLVNYNLDPKSVGNIYQQYELKYETKVLVARIEAAVKQTVAQYTAEEMLTKRGEVQTKIEEAVRAAVPPEFIITKYSLVNEEFSEQFEQAIEAKQVALQKAEQAKNELTRAEVDAKARIAQAEGEAKAIAIQAQAITQQGGKDYVELKTIEKWNGQGCTSYCGLEASTGLLISR